MSKEVTVVLLAADEADRGFRPKLTVSRWEMGPDVSRGAGCTEGSTKIP